MVTPYRIGYEGQRQRRRPPETVSPSDCHELARPISLMQMHQTGNGSHVAASTSVRPVEPGGTDRAKAHEIIHDLRNALGLVINYANLVAAELGGRPDVQEDLMEIRTAGTRAAELVADLSTLIASAERGPEMPLR